MPEDKRYALGHFILRAGLAFAFLYPPYAAIFDPIGWAGYFPQFVRNLPVDTTILLHTFGVLEALLAVWMLYGRQLLIPGVVMALLLLGIVVFNAGDFGILFRDVALAFLAIGLAVLPAPSERK